VAATQPYETHSPGWRAFERDAAAIEHLRKRTWPALKNAARQGRLIIFIDESGISERPTRVGHLGRGGETPIVQFLGFATPRTPVGIPAI